MSFIHDAGDGALRSTAITPTVRTSNRIAKARRKPEAGAADLVEIRMGLAQDVELLSDQYAWPKLPMVTLIVFS